MPEELKDAQLDQYVVCETCSKENGGTKVYWHRTLGVREVKGFLAAPRFECGRGHPVVLDGAR